MNSLNSVSGFFFNTTISITGNVSNTCLQEALNLCGTYEQRLSRFVPESDIWRINHAQGKPVKVGEDTLKNLVCAEKVRLASRGAFNIAIGSITELWDFSGASPVLPAKEALLHARQRMERARLIVEGNLVQTPQDTVIDLGGIAKGYICCCVAEFLRQEGASCGVLNFGGNVVTIGEHPEGRLWHVGLQSPSAKRNTALFASLESRDEAVVTSGVYERAFVLEGTLYHHLLDPRTCYPSKSPLLSATVVHKDGMLADALATALLLLGENEGFALLDTFNAQGVTLSREGKLRYSQTLPLKLLSS